MMTMITGMIFAIAGTAVAAAIFGSVAISYVMPTGDGILTPLEQRCMDVAQEGYAIHSAYPAITSLDEMPADDARVMIALDEIWMNECVAKLPHHVIIDIADKVERDPPSRNE